MVDKFTRTDLWFSNEGDFVLDGNGDLKDTGYHYGRSLQQEIRSRLASRPGDWKLESRLGIGSYIFDVLGENDTEETRAILRQAIIEALTFDRLLLPSEIEVLVLPVGLGEVLLRIIVSDPISGGESEITIGYNSDNQRFIG